MNFSDALSNSADLAEGEFKKNILMPIDQFAFYATCGC